MLKRILLVVFFLVTFGKTVQAQSNKTITIPAEANLVRSLRFSAPHWQALGPTAIPNAHSCDNAAETGLRATGKIQAFAINLLRQDSMYAAGGVGPGNSGPFSDAGIYRSRDGGGHWRKIDKGLTNTLVGALWLDQSNPSVLVASTWLDGIFRSADEGSTWSNVYPSPATSLVQVGSSLYAATASGVIVSADSGATWQTVLITSSAVRTLAWGAGAFYAGLEDGTIMTQQDPGSSWTRVLQGGTPGVTVWDITINPGNAQEAVAVLNNNGNLVNIVTTNGGSTWVTWPAPPTGGLCGSGGPAQVVAFDTVNPRIIYADFGGALYVSLDGGNSWTAKHLLEDIRLIQPVPGQPGALVVGGDQGIYISHDVGNTWASLNGDLTTNLLNMIAVNESEIITTVQDFSPISSFDGGKRWLQLSGAGPAVGENGVVVINPRNPSYQYVFNAAGFQYSTDGGHTFTPASTVPGNEWTFSGPANRIAVDPRNPSTVYVAAKDGVFQSTDWGVSWKLLSWAFRDPSLIVVGHDGAIFIGTPASGPTPGKLNLSHDGGATWTTSQLPSGSNETPNSLSVSPANAKVVVLGMSGTPNDSGGGVLISTDGGATFTSDNQGLVTRPTSNPAPFYTFSVQFAPASNPGIVVVATFDGLYISQAGNPWTDITGNAVPRWFEGIAWDNGFLYVSTYGQGVLRASVRQIIK